MKKLMILLAFAAFAACSKSKPATTTTAKPDMKMEPAAGGDQKKPDGDMKPEGDKKPEGGADPCAAPK